MTDAEIDTEAKKATQYLSGFLKDAILLGWEKKHVDDRGMRIRSVTTYELRGFLNGQAMDVKFTVSGREL